MASGYSYWLLFIICPLIFLASLIDAVAGGGGLISLPAYLLAGIPPHNAIATNKLSSGIGTCASTARFIKNKCVDWPTAIPSAALAILGSIAGAKLVLAIDEMVVRYIMLAILPVITLWFCGTATSRRFPPRRPTGSGSLSSCWPFR